MSLARLGHHCLLSLSFVIAIAKCPHLSCAFCRMSGTSFSAAQSARDSSLSKECGSPSTILYLSMCHFISRHRPSSKLLRPSSKVETVSEYQASCCQCPMFPFHVSVIKYFPGALLLGKMTLAESSVRDVTPKIRPMPIFSSIRLGVFLQRLM